MKKKFFAMYALVGALVASPIFTSCIDDTESESVTAIRTQKAEAIRLAAEIAKAKEAHDAALRELELLEKQAEHDKTMADYAKQKAEYEAKLLEFQLDIKENAEKLAAFGVVALTDLTTAYTGALEDVAKSKKTIYGYNKNIADLEAGKVSVQNFVANQTATLNNTIAADEAALAALKKAQEDGMDKDALETEIAELEVAKDKAEQTLKEVKVQYGIDLTQTTVLFNTHAKNLATVKAAAYTHISSAVRQNANTGLMYLSEADLATARTNFETSVGNVEGAEKNLAAAIAKLGTEADKKDATYYDATLATPANVQTLYAKLAEAKETFAAAEKVYNEKNDAVEKAKKAVADAQTALDTERAKETPDAAKVTELTTALTTAQTALATAQTALTAAIVTDYNTAKSDLATAEDNVLTAKDGIVVFEATLANAKKNVEEFETAVAAFAGEDYEAYKEAYEAYKAANDAYTTANAEYSALNSLNSNTLRDNIAETIINKEKAIAENKAKLENLKANLRIADNQIDTEADIEAAIAYIEEMIAIEEIKLATYEKLAEEAKAALDAYLAEDGGEAEA